jgi:hypothetical protein
MPSNLHIASLKVSGNVPIGAAARVCDEIALVGMSIRGWANIVRDRLRNGRALDEGAMALMDDLVTKALQENFRPHIQGRGK